MGNTWVDNIDKAVEALKYHIEGLKVKAESNIPAVAKLNKLTLPSICNKTIDNLFKVGSGYWERSPETVEQVDTRLAALKAQMEADKSKLAEESKANDPLIENNKSIHTKIQQIMKDLGVPNQYSRSYYKTANSRKQTVETSPAGYLGDLTRNVPVGDDRFTYSQKIESQWKYIEAHANKLKAEFRAKEVEKAKAEKNKKSVQALARLQLKYGLDEDSEWSDVLEALDKADKYFALARALEDQRGDWSEGFDRVQYAVDAFVVETEEDKEIFESLHELAYDEDLCDGRTFRDCEWNYSVLYGKVSEELLKDYETIQEYYEKY